MRKIKPVKGTHNAGWGLRFKQDEERKRRSLTSPRMSSWSKPSCFLWEENEKSILEKIMIETVWGVTMGSHFLTFLMR